MPSTIIGEYMAGGYRPGSGRSKSGYYHGIYCGSTYELCWVIYNLDHQVQFTRFPGKLEHDGVVYYPDFLLSDGKTIIETKGYEKDESVNRKTAVAEFLGYVVKVLRKNDLEHMFEYVRETYGTKKFYELYDGYRPKYTYECHFCKVSFDIDVKKNTELKFCSRSCAGKHHGLIMSSSSEQAIDIKRKISKSLLGRKMKPYKRKYGQIWITNGVANSKIKCDDEVPLGFYRGRTRSCKK